MQFRRILVSGALCFVLAVALAFACLPAFKSDKLAIMALLALILALTLGWRLLHHPRRSIWCVALAVVALIPATVIARAFGRVDMLAVLFHAEFGTEGATLDGLETEILQGVVSGGLILLAVWLLAGLWQWRNAVIVGAAALILAANPFVRFGLWWAFTPAVVSDLAGRMQPPTVAQPAGRPADLMIIYLEGTDRQFADPDAWGDVYAPLNALAAQGMVFTNVGQIAGTGWSQAGMIATQCGVPVVPRGLNYRNNFDTFATIMPNISCLGDNLATFGYGAAFVVGVDLEFGGLGTFYASHGIDDLTGLAEQQAIYPVDKISAAMATWFVDDQMVFETARTKFASMLATDRPLALIVETIGPHGKTGFLSRDCTADGQSAKSHDAVGVLRCTIGDTMAFVQNTQAAHAAARPDRALRIVIMSDHLWHGGRPRDVAPAFAGFNTVIFLGDPASAGRVIDKPGSMIDVYPTLLEWMGFAKAPVAGNLGRSLLGTAPTLVEVHGIDLLDRMITDDPALSQQIWAE